MARVFEDAGFEVPRPPWPRMPLRRGDAALRLRQARRALRAGDGRPRRRAARARSSRSSQSVLGGGGVVRGLNAGARELPRSELDALTELRQALRRRRAGVGVRAGGRARGARRRPSSCPTSEREDVTRALGGKPGDLLLIVADKPDVAATALGELRLELARRFDLVPEGRHDALWVVDFPMFEWNEDERPLGALHHPFTAPPGSFDDPGAMRSRAATTWCSTASEIGGGSIRIHRPEVQQQVFNVLGISEEEARGALRLPARRAALRRAAARRHRARHRPDRRRSWPAATRSAT